MKKLFLLIAVLCPLAANSAAAHVLEQDSGIGAVLHIDPADDPIAGQPSNFYFDFKDPSGKFKVEDCDCRLIIERGGQKIHDQPFDRYSGATYAFPERNIYVVKAAGSPRSPGQFPAFELDYTIRVERVAENSGNSSNQSKLIWLLAGAGLIFIVVFLLIRRIIVHKVK